MARGRKPRGRSPALNDGRVTRTMSRTLACQGVGVRVWRNQHDRKTPFTFCQALKEEKAQHGTVFLGDSDRRGRRRNVYPCRYGTHYLIETAPLHWHIGQTGEYVYRT